MEHESHTSQSSTPWPGGRPCSVFWSECRPHRAQSLGSHSPGMVTWKPAVWRPVTPPCSAPGKCPHQANRLLASLGFTSCRGKGWGVVTKYQGATRETCPGQRTALIRSSDSISWIFRGTSAPGSWSLSNAIGGISASSCFAPGRRRSSISALSRQTDKAQSKEDESQ